MYFLNILNRSNGFIEAIQNCNFLHKLTLRAFSKYITYEYSLSRSLCIRLETLCTYYFSKCLCPGRGRDFERFASLPPSWQGFGDLVSASGDRHASVDLRRLFSVSVQSWNSRLLGCSCAQHGPILSALWPP